MARVKYVKICLLFKLNVFEKSNSFVQFLFIIKISFVCCFFLFISTNHFVFLFCLFAPRWINLDHTRTRTVFSLIFLFFCMYNMCVNFFYRKNCQKCKMKTAEKISLSNQLVKMFSFFVSRWLDLMMLECFFPIISVQRIIRILIMIMILIEHRLKRNLKCLSENFTSIIFLFIGK